MFRAFALSVALPLFSQIFPPQHRAHLWDGSTLAAFNPADHALTLLSPAGSSSGKERSLILDPGYEFVHLQEGRIWVNNKLASQRLKDKPVKRLLSSRDGKDWTLEAQFPLNPGVDVIAIHPLGQDRFLLIAFTAIRHGGESSRFAIAKLGDSQELVVERVLDMGLKRPWTSARTPEGFASRFGVNEDYLALFLSVPYVLRNEDFLVIVSDRAGYLWLMDLRKERPSLQLIRVHPEVKENALSGAFPIEHCILDAQPLRDGHFLFATRSADAVLFAALNHPKPKDSQAIRDPLFRQDRQVQKQLSVQDFPDLLWWDLDPHSGTLSRHPAPQGVPERFSSVEEIQQFRFWFTPSGHVLASNSTYDPSPPARPKPATVASRSKAAAKARE